MLPDYVEDSILYLPRAAFHFCCNGEIMWSWQAPKGTGFPSLLLDRDILFAAVQGYTYALDPHTGHEIWQNPMKGFGFGITSLATWSGHTPVSNAAQAAADAATAAAASQPPATH